MATTTKKATRTSAPDLKILNPHYPLSESEVITCIRIGEGIEPPDTEAGHIVVAFSQSCPTA